MLFWELIKRISKSSSVILSIKWDFSVFLILYGIHLHKFAKAEAKLGTILRNKKTKQNKTPQRKFNKQVMGITEDLTRFRNFSNKTSTKSNSYKNPIIINKWKNRYIPNNLTKSLIIPLQMPSSARRQSNQLLDLHINKQIETETLVRWGNSETKKKIIKKNKKLNLFPRERRNSLQEIKDPRRKEGGVSVKTVEIEISPRKTGNGDNLMISYVQELTRWICNW